MKFPLHVILLFFSLQFFSQSFLDYHKAEKYILINKLDSAKYHIDKLHDSIEVKLIKQLAYSVQLSYKDYYQFIINLSKRQNVDILDILKFVNREVKDPIKPEQIDTDFFNIKWTLITQLVEDVHLEEANLEQRKLENYVNQFSSQDSNFLWAKTKLKTHPVVMYFIKKEIEKGRKLSLESLKIAEDLQDTELQIAFLYNYSPYLGYQKKILEYIETLEKCIELEGKLSEKSLFYYQSIRSLINVYIYAGLINEKVFELIEELYNSYASSSSYLLYAQLVGNLDKDSKLLNEVLQKFDVKNVLELTKKLESEGKDLNSTSFYYLIDKCAIALHQHKYYDDAMEYKQKAIELNSKIYSEELSTSLANFEIKKAVELKEKEIEIEKEQTKLYLIIALLCFFLLIISFISIKKLKRQSEQLTDKNILINKSLDEKELLIREMHHRVKNNFQLITSLLDLQTEEVEDNDVKAIFEKGKSRIKSMSLIHQKLYGTDSGLIKFDDFIRLLVRELSFLYKCDENLKLDINVKEFYFDVDTAIPLSLILNELITNAFKYAFKNSMDNVLYISLEKTPYNDYLLVFKDNGIGIPEGFNKIATKGAGLKLVSRLVRQLQGKLKLINDSGAKFEILFKDTKERKKTV